MRCWEIAIVVGVVGVVGCGGAADSEAGSGSASASESESASGSASESESGSASESESESASGSASASASGSASASASASESASESGAASTDDSSTSDADESSDSTTASTPDYPTPHFPLAVGLQWTYRFTRVDGEIGTACDNQGDEHVTTVSDFDASTGVYTLSEEPWCYFATLEYRIEDPYVDVNSGAWYHQLLLPPELDATWAAGGASGAAYVWDEHHDTYTVEAGTFDDCWRRKQQSYDVWQIYCANVGMVVSHYAAWGGDSRAELVAWSG